MKRLHLLYLAVFVGQLFACSGANSPETDLGGGGEGGNPDGSGGNAGQGGVGGLAAIDAGVATNAGGANAGGKGGSGGSGLPVISDAMPAAIDAKLPTDPVSVPVPSGAIEWTGKGANSSFSTPENWSGNVAPGANDDVVLDGGPMKNCVIDKVFMIKSLTVTPGFPATLNIASPGVISGNMVLSGVVAINFNPHIHFEVKGPIVDLRNVTKLVTGFAKGSISMTGKTVQTLLPPTDTSIELCEMQSFGGSTMKLGAPLKAIGLYVESDGAIDFNGQDVTVKLVGIAGPVSGIGGVKLSVNGYANYTTNGLGFSYHSENKGTTDLAPAKPWKLVVQQKVGLYGNAPNTFTIKNAKIANLDVTGSETIKLMGCTNAGGNTGLTFP